MQQKVEIIPAAEADLQLDAGILCSLNGLPHPVNVIINGLFAEDVLAGLGGLHDEIGVGIGGRADEHRFDFGIVDNLGGILCGILNAIAVKQGFRLRIHEGIRHGFDFQFGDKIGNVLRVYLADAAGADNANFHKENLL